MNGVKRCYIIFIMDSLINKKINKEEDVVLEQKPKKRFIKKILFLILIGLVISAVISWWNGGLGVSGDYQAVFLDNNQVYFGKVSSLSSSFINLKDVFYLQVNEQIQPLKKGQEPQPQFVLVKLGLREIHSPTDAMKINRDHILFIEDLKPDSQVVQGIKQFNANQ